MGDYTIDLLFLLVFLVLSAFFALSETAITSVSRVKIKQLLEKKARGAKTLNRLRENPSRTLATILVGNNIVNIGASALAAAIIMRFLAERGFAGVGIAVGIATGVMAFFILVFGEITPKTVAIRNAPRLALFAAPIVAFFAVVIRPIVIFLMMMSRPFIRLFGGQMPEKGPFITAEEIKILVSGGVEEGIIEEEEKEMIHSIFEFGETTAHEVMTPRPDIICEEMNSPVEKVIKTIIEKGHSRIPIYEGNVDNIVGVVYAKEILDERKRSEGLRGLLHPIIFIPEGKKLDELLHQMQAAKTHIAILVDEYGGVAGLVTFEDLIEEIVGEIQDEFDREEKAVEFIDKNTAIVDGRLGISDANEKVGVNIPKGDYDTVGGFVFGLLGKVPAVGNTMRYGKLVFSVEKIAKRRITRVKITKLEEKKEGVEMVGG